jgi:hypothetical protein
MGSYRPPNWNQPANIATVVLVYSPPPGTPQYTPSGIGVTLPNKQTRYVFDAVIRTGHNQRLTKTQHPIQTGANISDHAYIEPGRVMLDIGMSDAVASYSGGMWSGGPTKSVSAYQTLLALQYSRVPLMLTTKYRSYTNLVITAVDADDTVKTIASLKARVEFEEIFFGSTQVVADSARPQVTSSTPLGTVYAQPPSPQDVSQYQVPATVPPINVPGAGDFSSTNINNLPGAP